MGTPNPSFSFAWPVFHRSLSLKPFLIRCRTSSDTPRSRSDSTEEDSNDNSKENSMRVICTLINAEEEEEEEA